MDDSALITVSDNIRVAYADNPEFLDELLSKISVHLRLLQHSLLGRNINAEGFRIHIHLLEGPDYVNGKFDPFHDQGNATNHRVSQCTERCK